MDRAVSNGQGAQHFRLAEDLSDRKLRATLQFKAVGLAEGESLEIQLNGSLVPDQHITRHFDADGQNKWQGKVLPAFHLYIVDLNGSAQNPPIVNGDNQLTVRMIGKEDQGQGEVIIDELEVYIYLRE